MITETIELNITENIELDITEIPEWIERPLVDHCKTPGGSGRTDQSRKSWDLGHGFKQSLRMLNTGWPDGVDQMQSDLSDLREDLATEMDAHEWTMGKVGYRPHVAAVLAGKPNCMIRRHTTKAPVRILRLHLPVCYSASIDAMDAVRRGAAVVALVDSLENSGVRVEINAVAMQEFSRARYREIETDTHVSTIIRVKRAGEPVQIADLVFPLAHPSMLRRIMFDVWERQEISHVMALSPFGIPKRFNAERFPALADGLVVSPLMHDNARWSARKWYDTMKADVERHFNEG